MRLRKSVSSASGTLATGNGRIASDCLLGCAALDWVMMSSSDWLLMFPATEVGITLFYVVLLRPGAGSDSLAKRRPCALPRQTVCGERQTKSTTPAEASRNGPWTTEDRALVSRPCPPVQYSKQSTYFVLARFRYCFNKPSFLTLRLTLRSCVSFRNVGFSVLAPKSFVLSPRSFGSTGASAVLSCRGCIAGESFSRLTCRCGFQYKPRLICKER